MIYIIYFDLESAKSIILCIYKSEHYMDKQMLEHLLKLHKLDLDTVILEHLGKDELEADEDIKNGRLTEEMNPKEALEFLNYLKSKGDKDVSNTTKIDQI